ncbi:MAG: DUF559 domain-containing protein [Chloroflexota bacterium]|nr:DUF559 domain-containing protein [Chloroflexota bacterium]
MDSIVSGQRVSREKVERARDLRRGMTEVERVLWQHLRANHLRNLHFRRQQIIDGFIVDFYCHAAGLVVEVDGLVHQEQVEDDAERERVPAGRGLRVLRVTNDVLHDLPRVLERIAELARPSSPSLQGEGAER